MELFTTEGISHVASVVGIPLYMDKATETRRRVQFAKACVEIGLEDEFPESIILDIEDIGQTTVYIEYPWRPVVCSICGKFLVIMISNVRE